ncbi:hypothetical protein SBOR_4335 [Sclerotinia borealis F-4128]|uniref:Myb-like domain-containing protein n=1 Tax=Sclerotinia borealis (strain F-4128) TaxID=1432307 RepID=W9CHD9_SCLBF|nr:hypothetical protein SBOR_4335 [Sclerotinia borealis F-4128]
MSPMVSPALTQASLAGSQTAKPKNKIHVSFTDWVLGGSLLSINAAANDAVAATHQRSDSNRIRATAGKDKKGRNIVILEDRNQNRVVGGEVEMLVVRKVGGRKTSDGRSRSASGGSNTTVVKAKIVEEVLETVVEEKIVEEVKKEEKVEVKKDESADDKGEHTLNLQKDEGKKEEEKKPEGKAEEPITDVVPETAANPITEEKDTKPEPEIVIVEVEVEGKDKDKEKNKDKDKDAKTASKGEDEPESDSTKLEEPSADTIAIDSKEKTDSNAEKPTEVKEDDKNGKVEAVDGNKWTKEQDEKLMSMKKENKTWKDIAGELGASKKDVVARYKVLQAQEKEEDEEDEEEKEKPKKPEKKKKIKCTAQTDNTEDTEDEIYISPNCPYHHPKHKSASSSSSKQDKKKKRKSYGELDRNRDEGEEEEEEEREERAQGHSNGHGHGNRNGQGNGHLRPDKIWSAEDCETLEYLMEKHRSTQWLQLQAGFYNYTGRMVNAEFIERKFRKDGLA